MSAINKLGLGCMGMSNRRNSKKSIKSIHTAMDNGITQANNLQEKY